MRFVQFLQNDKQCVGIELGAKGDFINLTAADPSFPFDLRSFIENGDSMLEAAKRFGDSAIQLATLNIVLTRLTPFVHFDTFNNYI